MYSKQFVGRWVIASILVFTVAHPLVAGTIHYKIAPGGQYSYSPSPESFGFPECDSDSGAGRELFGCVFGIDGSFSVMVDPDTRIATLLDVDLSLIGNEEVQQNAPTPFVTAEGVADWLEDRSFENLITLGPFEVFADETYPELLLTELLTGTVTLTGGYNNTPSDGDGVHFELSAKVVPEPSSFVLCGIGFLLIVFCRHGRRRAIC